MNEQDLQELRIIRESLSQLMERYPEKSNEWTDIGTAWVIVGRTVEKYESK